MMDRMRIRVWRFLRLPFINNRVNTVDCIKRKTQLAILNHIDMLSLFSGRQLLSSSLTKLAYEIKAPVNSGEAGMDCYIGDHLLERLVACHCAGEVRKGLMNRFGDAKKWKRFSFISNGRAIEFQLRDVVVDLNFTRKECPLTGLTVISVAGEIAGDESFADYLGKIVKFVTHGVLHDQFGDDLPAFNVSCVSAQPL